MSDHQFLNRSSPIVEDDPPGSGFGFPFRSGSLFRKRLFKNGKSVSAGGQEIIGGQQILPVRIQGLTVDPDLLDPIARGRRLLINKTQSGYLQKFAPVASRSETPCSRTSFISRPLRRKTTGKLSKGNTSIYLFNPDGPPRGYPSLSRLRSRPPDPLPFPVGEYP